MSETANVTVARVAVNLPLTVVAQFQAACIAQQRDSDDVLGELIADYAQLHAPWPFGEAQNVRV